MSPKRFSLFAGLFFVSVGLGCGVWPLGAAAEQPYPNRLIKIIHPYVAGGPTDIVTRAIADKMSISLKQPIVVENRPGAGGNIGTEAIARAAPDGYTLGMVLGTTLTVNPSLYKKLPFDPDRDFRLVSIVAVSGNMLVVHPSVPINSVAEFVAYAKAAAARKEPIAYASGGIGTPGHLVMENFRVRADFEAIHVPYRGNAPMVIDLVAGQVKIGFVTSAGIVERIFLASPLAIVEVAYEQFFVTGDIYPNILVSLKEAVLGFGLAIVFGVLLGLAMGRFDRVRRVLEPFVMALYSTPSVALLPLFVLWLGIGLWSKVLIVFLGGVFAILVNTMAGVRSVNPRLIETARAFTASEAEIFLYVILPASTPYIVAGIRLAIGRILISVFVAELYASNQGIGFVITQAGATYNTALMLMAILLLTLTGMALSQSLSMVEDRYLARFREH